MDKEEFRIKLEEINHLVENKDYKAAMGVVDSIDWRRVKNVRTLCVVGEIYAANKRYEDSRDIFLLAYHRSSIGKNILYRLIEVSLKMNNFEEAAEYYEEFCSVAPNDNTSFVLKYKIMKAQGSPIEDQIAVLEEYKNKEFTEKWSYELAQLYYKSGQKEKCESLCNEMILWFSEGSYVMKALNLKQRMGTMTTEEKEKYEQQLTPNLHTPEELREAGEEESLESGGESEEDSSKDDSSTDSEEVIESIPIRSEDLNNSETLQEKISKGIRDLFGVKKNTEEAADEVTAPEEQEELIQSDYSGAEFEEVPELEKEGEELKEIRQELTEEEQESVDLSQTMRMPEKKSVKPLEKEEALEEAQKADEVEAAEEPAAEETETPTITEEIVKEEIEEPVFGDNFNLEDTILAAASAQGIEIPEESEEPETAEKEPEAAQPSVDSEDSEEISEEDLAEAEKEFLNGPSKKTDIPDLVEEDLLETMKNVSEDHFEENEFLNEMLKDSKTETPVVTETAKEVPVTDAPEASESEKSQEEPKEEAVPESEEEQLERFIDSINPKNKLSQMDIVARDRKLTDEEIKLFSYFVKVPGMEEQLIDTLCNVQLEAADTTSNTGNVIVMGGSETGKTRLISGLIPAICKELNLSASKVAYVFADQVNGKDLRKITKKLAGGFFVIEKANQLDPETADRLVQAMEQDTEGMIVILEDEKIGMRKLIARYPKLAKKFTSTINIPVFTNDELASFAKVYAMENGYKIDNMGMLSLYNRIGNSQKADQPMNIGSVKGIVDSAIARTQAGIRKFRKNSAKVDRDGFKILTEKDFNIK